MIQLKTYHLALRKEAGKCDIIDWKVGYSVHPLASTRAAFSSLSYHDSICLRSLNCGTFLAVEIEKKIKSYSPQGRGSDVS